VICANSHVVAHSATEGSVNNNDFQPVILFPENRKTVETLSKEVEIPHQRKRRKRFKKLNGNFRTEKYNSN
jgi:hypothetical protein